MMDDRIIELETRLTFQEEHLDALTRTVSRQQQLIEDLRRELDELRQRFKAIAAASPPHREEPPPHY
ncbi:MAG: SlyX family protein [Chromatiales bacterium]|jgi:SlyX protein